MAMAPRRTGIRASATQRVIEAEDEGNAADRLDRDRQVGQSRRQAEAAEELGGAGGGEHEDLQAGMGQEQNAERDAQDQGGIGSGAGSRSWKNLLKGCPHMISN